MSIINSYINKLKRQYPKTRAVLEQFEEIRDSLRQKSEEFQLQGMTCADAERTAVASVGDISPLLKEVSGQIRAINIRKLKRDNAIFFSMTIFIELLLCTSIYCYFDVQFANSAAILMIYLPFLLGLGIWMAVTCTRYRRRPVEIVSVDYPYKKRRRNAMLGWLSITAAFFILGVIISNSIGNDPVFSEINWIIWPSIAAFNWPLYIIIYFKQLATGYYDVKESFAVTGRENLYATGR